MNRACDKAFNLLKLKFLLCPGTSYYLHNFSIVPSQTLTPGFTNAFILRLIHHQVRLSLPVSWRYNVRRLLFASDYFLLLFATPREF